MKKAVLFASFVLGMLAILTPGMASAGTCDPGGVEAPGLPGVCWRYGAQGQSCDQVCASHGGYNAATKTYVGSGGTNAHCEDVWNSMRKTSLLMLPVLL